MGNAPSRGWVPETASPLPSKVRPATGLYLTIPRRRRISVACSARFSGEFCLDVPVGSGGAGLLGVHRVSGGSSPRSRAKNLPIACLLVQFVPPSLIYSRQTISPVLIPVRIRRPLNAHLATVAGHVCFLPRVLGSMRAAWAKVMHPSAKRSYSGLSADFIVSATVVKCDSNSAVSGMEMRLSDFHSGQ